MILMEITKLNAKRILYSHEWKWLKIMEQISQQLTSSFSWGFSIKDIPLSEKSVLKSL